MRQIVIDENGGPEVMVLRDNPKPTPAPGELLIRVKAAGVNFADILARLGIYPDAPPKPYVVGYEIAGMVEATGHADDDDWLDREVFAMMKFGGYSEYVCVKTSQVVEKPRKLSFEEAAAIPVNYLTAYQLIVVMGGLRAGESILIHNAGGGVGLAAIDVANHVGAVIYGTASSSKHMFLMKRGLDYPIDYRTQNWLSIVKQLTGGRGVELVLDPIGGRNLKKSYKALRHTGRLGVFGMAGAVKRGSSAKWQLLKTVMQTPKFSPIRMMNGNKSVFGVHIGHMWHEPEKVHEWMLAISDGIREGWVRPHVDQTFPLEQAGEAHRYIEDRKNIGKVVLVM
ncbi:zinc-binding dehydrogenase [candidate division KSB1 bacterium]|nr:zinc-binding dehydrogenase [candidate division KSB1 bacterium]